MTGANEKVVAAVSSTAALPPSDNRTINGVPADQWGTWCAHGHRIVEPDPNADFPRGRVVDPWPCDADDCTREQFEADMEAAEAEYQADLWRDHYRMIGGA
ncbi:hypothetical protein GCM10010399_43940 [Dactylosporangium fulvum]|uniref:Uncharacterized protein n=1 Tax=Dactylosporangium fulvum TaxID=53359 RepID=A0ABY5W9P3_9ACTN|nr:hypothetical protein [Dactylosporangium fulvum]UWP85939.1 hypothetical protein Dfulv_17470 [Dactylosporangium fulvum]